MTGSGGRIATFYSYKGGVGRSFALANCAWLLARWGARVLVVDWDLEAPGLHLYFSGAEQSPGLLEVVEGHEPGRPLDWRSRLLRWRGEGKQALPQELHLLTAGAPADFARRTQAFPWAERWAEQGLAEAVEEMREQWLAEYDIVLIDSRTGLTDISGICTIFLPDILVLLGSANRQSMEGLRQVMAMVDRGRDALYWPRERVRVLPVLSRFEGRMENELGQSWTRRFVETFAPAFGNWLEASAEPAALAQKLRIPAVARWSFGEELPVAIEEEHDEEAVTWSLTTLAALLEHRLEGAHRLLEERGAYVQESRRRVAGLDCDLLIYAREPLPPGVAELQRQVEGAGKKVRRAESWEPEARASHVLLVVVGAPSTWVEGFAELPARHLRQPGAAMALCGEPPAVGALASIRGWRPEELLGWAEAQRLLPPRPPPSPTHVHHVVVEAPKALGLPGGKVRLRVEPGRLCFLRGKQERWVPLTEILRARWQWSSRLIGRYLCLILEVQDPERPLGALAVKAKFGPTLLGAEHWLEVGPQAQSLNQQLERHLGFRALKLQEMPPQDLSEQVWPP